MKAIERLLIYGSLLVTAAIVALGLFWMGRAIYMVAAGAPVMEEVRAMALVSTGNSAETEGDTAATEMAATAPAEGTETTPTEAAAPAGIQVSAAAGEKIFKKCKACHAAAADGKDKTGPNLWSVVNRPVASNEGFGYSDALTGLADQTWTAENLDAYLADPKAYAPGNKMSFAGLKKEEDRENVIFYLAQQADTPLAAADLGFAAAAAGAATAEVTEAAATTDDAADAPVEIDPVPYPEGVTYANPPARTPEAQAEIDARVAALEELAPTLDYERSRFHELHFPPKAAEASSEECLVCHKEILDHTPRDASPAGVPASDTIAWYQTLDTYEGDQASFHWRHLESDFAKQVMNLECSFCHKGNDPREESPDMVPTRSAYTAESTPEFTLRKMVNPSETCLRCHGAMPNPVEIMGLGGPWHEIREDMEWPEAPNGCMSCHAETFRTQRHNVEYLNAANIEEIARAGSSDTCYGCHGGRAWYRIAYPYPRHAWPDMDPEVPEWAADRPTQSDPEYALPASE